MSNEEKGDRRIRVDSFLLSQAAKTQLNCLFIHSNTIPSIRKGNLNTSNFQRRTLNEKECQSDVTRAKKSNKLESRD